MAERYNTSLGHCRFLGATIENGGVNFAIYCKNAKRIELLLFKDPKDLSPDIIKLDHRHKSGYYFHVFVNGIGDGQLYGWRITEVINADINKCWDPTKVLLDPYCYRIVFPEDYSRSANCNPGSNIFCCPKSVVLDLSGYDWEGDTYPRHSFRKTVIYEMHVKGFTAHQSSGVPASKRGTYAGLVEKIPYLQELGIPAVELLPVFQFDPSVNASGKPNYWGYDPISFFSPHSFYSSDQSIHGPANEFRDMVKALHRAGIEIYLDVVYNHTSEGDEKGPVFNFKGIDQNEYYLVDNEGDFVNFTGCGNTINASSPVVKNMITDSLRFWTEEMHVDGFRFDLASILSRNTKGEPISDAPTLLGIDNDSRLANTKIIAEAWDAAGLYQVGSLPGKRWREWNGQFRDVVRKFIRGDDDTVSTLINRINGSPDIYSSDDADPYKSLNFVTCHDGFTLWDLVSYNKKHNLENGENNVDGSDYNFSFNNGVEGETDSAEINEVRLRQAKNMMFMNLFSIGTCMILMGDEILRTQHGNNNAYCQDNQISYMNWKPNKMQKNMLRFTSLLIRAKTEFGDPNDESDIVTLHEKLRACQHTLHGVKPHLPDLSPSSHSFGIMYYAILLKTYVYIYINNYWEDLEVTIPPVPNSSNSKWLRCIDTSLPPPHDVTLYSTNKPEIDGTYKVKSKSIVLMLSN